MNENPSQHLSNEQIDTIFARWYSGEKVKTLLEEYDIEKIHNRSFSKHFPPISSNENCMFCNLTMYAYRADSACYKKYSLFYDAETAHCLNCGHSQSTYCKCEGCIAEKKEKAKEEALKEEKRIEKRNQELENLYQKTELINFYDIGFIELIYLYSICYQSTCEDVALISPLSCSEAPLTPSKEWDLDCIKGLLEYLSPFCDKEELLQINEEGHASWTGHEVFYRIKIEDHEKLSFLNSLLEYIKLEIELDENKHDLINLCEKLLTQECLDYLEFMRKSHKLSHQVGIKTTALFKNIIREWRVDQIYTIIWMACRDAVAYKVKNGLPNQYASNIMINKIDKYVDKAKKDNWQIKHYYRDHSKKQSTLSYVIFNKILELGGFGVEYNLQDIITLLSSKPDNLAETATSEDIAHKTEEI